MVWHAAKESNVSRHVTDKCVTVYIFYISLQHGRMASLNATNVINNQPINLFCWNQENAIFMHSYLSNSLTEIVHFFSVKHPLGWDIVHTKFELNPSIHL